MYAWYLSYGSNINTHRFHTYITGGRYNETVYEQGCRNKSLPVAARSVTIQHDLYFAGHYTKWQDQGVAFLTQTPNPTAKTYAKMYLIEISQFEDVVKQENGIDVSEPLFIDYEEIQAYGYTDLNDKPYGRLLQLSVHEGYPIYTFTAPIDRTDINPPSRAYLDTIINGITKSHSLSRQALLTHFQNYKGLSSRHQLRSLTA